MPQGIKSTSIVFAGSNAVAEDPYALFCAEDRNGCHLEVKMMIFAGSWLLNSVVVVGASCLGIVCFMGGEVGRVRGGGSWKVVGNSVKVASLLLRFMVGSG